MIQLNIDDIRKRPGLYVGSTGQDGVYNLIFFLVDEFIDSKGKVNISVTVSKDNSLIIESDKPIVKENSLNLTVTEALSDIFELSYSNEAQVSIKVIFRPSHNLFIYNKIDYHRLYNRFRELAQLNENVRIILADEENRNLIQYRDGLNSMLFENMYGYFFDCSPTNIHFNNDGIEVSMTILLGYPADATISYVNNWRTHGNGTHVHGLYDGVYSAFKKYMERFSGEKIEYARKDIINDLNFVISVKCSQPKFAGSTKRILDDSKVGEAVKKGVVESLGKILETDSSVFDSSSVMRRAAFLHVVREGFKRHNPGFSWDE